MADQCSLPAALAVCAAAGVAALCTSASLAQQPAPAHRELGNLVFESVPLPDAALMARLERYQQSRQATFLDWLADGGLLVATRFGDSEQLHRVAAPLGMREQLTFYQDPIEWARAPRGGSGFVFLKDQGGDENAQVYYHSGGGEVRQLTHGAFIHGSPVWAHDGRRVAFYGNDRDSLSYDVYVADVTSGAAPQLLVGGRRPAAGVEIRLDQRELSVPRGCRDRNAHGARGQPPQSRHPHGEVRSRRPQRIRADRRGRGVRAAQTQGSGHTPEPQRHARRRLGRGRLRRQRRRALRGLRSR